MTRRFSHGEQQHGDENDVKDAAAQDASGGKSNAQDEDRTAKRVASLDIFRGFTVAVLSLLLVACVCGLFVLYFDSWYWVLHGVMCS